VQREVRCAKRFEGERQVTRPPDDYPGINESGDLGKFGVGLIQAFLLEVAAQVHAFSMDEGHVVDADEAHDLAQVGFLMVGSATGMDATASGQHEGALAG
jgi:hypothetical protein